MTLIVTAVSKSGVVMVGDSAETTERESGLKYVRTGARKVVPVAEMDAGISMWGTGSVGEVPMDVWIEGFVADYATESWSLRDLAQKLAETLNAEGVFPGVHGTSVGGFHIAGYENMSGHRLPSVYHVHNQHPPEQPHELRVNHDFPASVYKQNVGRYRSDLRAGRVEWHVRNGAYQNFITVWDHIVGRPKSAGTQPVPGQSSVLGFLQSQGVGCPYPDTLASHARFYAFLVEIVARLLSMSTALQTIAMPLSVLTISESGIQDYQPAVMRASTTTVMHAEQETAPGSSLSGI